MTNLTLERAIVADLGTVLRLLSESGLPVADLDQHIEAFTLANSAGTVVGSVGLELYGELGLLRSLCVAQAHRSQGTARDLLTAITAHAPRARDAYAVRRDRLLLLETDQGHQPLRELRRLVELRGQWKPSAVSRDHFEIVPVRHRPAPIF